jgi:hypothetical protein
LHIILRELIDFISGAAMLMEETQTRKSEKVTTTRINKATTKISRKSFMVPELLDVM